MFLEVNKAEYLEEYKIRLWFNNGMVKDVDLSDSLNGEIFKPLLDKEYFKNFTIHFNTIEWKNGADFAPEYLFEKGVAVNDINEKCTGKVAEKDIPYDSEK